MSTQRLSEEVGRMLQRRVTPGADEQTRRRQLCGEGAVTVLQAIALKQVERALDGDARACAFVRECTGEKEREQESAPATLETLLRLLEEQSDDS